MEQVQSQKEEVLRLCADIDVVLSNVLLARVEKERTLRDIAGENLRCLQDVLYWQDRRFTITRQDLQLISVMKTRLFIGHLEKLPHGSSQVITLMQSALQEERSCLQLLVAGGEPLSPRGSGAKGSDVSSGTTEAGKAKIDALKRAVGAAEEFLLTEESQGQDFALLKKLEILERTLGTTVEKMENSQGRLQLAPAEADDVE